MLLPWLVRHAAFVLSSFSARHRERTAFEEVRMVEYDSPVLHMFERAIAKMSGFASDTNGHWFGPETGVIRARLMRRCPEGEQRAGEQRQR